MISGRRSVHCAQDRLMRGLLFEMRSHSFLEEGRVTILVFSSTHILLHYSPYPGHHYRYHYFTVIIVLISVFRHLGHFFIVTLI